MTIFLPTLATVFGALCVWLTVRSFNRKERWAKWTLAVLMGVPVLYVTSFGPACWITSKANTGEKALPIVYRPITFAMGESDAVFRLAQDYASLHAKSTWGWWKDYRGYWHWTDPLVY